MRSRIISKILKNKENSYHVLHTIGEGGFGTVSRCVNQRTNEDVAIKIIRKRRDQRKEIKMTEALRELDPDETNIVRFIEHFKWERYACLVFELLDESLDDLLFSRRSLTLEEIRPVAHQVLTALDALHTIGVVHNDLKLDNIMLVKNKTPYKVKIIDFGMAFKTSKAECYQGVEMQVLRLRAPEIILGHPVSEAVDLWSFGCILVQLLLGWYLFEGRNAFEILKHIVNVVDQPSDRVLDASQHANKFFVKSEHWDNPKWSLKSLKEYDKENEWRTYLLPWKVKRLDDLLDFREVGENMDDARAFVNLLKCLLQTDPEQRIPAGRALSHSFVTMKHLMKQISLHLGDNFNQRLSGETETMTQSSPSPEEELERTASTAGSHVETSADGAPEKRPRAAGTPEKMSSTAGAPEETLSTPGAPEETLSTAGAPVKTCAASASELSPPSAGKPDTQSSAGTPEEKPCAAGASEVTPSSAGKPEDTSSGTPKKKPCAVGATEKTPSFADGPVETQSTSGPPAEGSPVKQPKTCLNRIHSFFRKVKSCFKRNNNV